MSSQWELQWQEESARKLAAIQAEAKELAQQGIDACYEARHNACWHLPLEEMSHRLRVIEHAERLLKEGSHV